MLEKSENCQDFRKLKSWQRGFVRMAKAFTDVGRSLSELIVSKWNEGSIAFLVAVNLLTDGAFYILLCLTRPYTRPLPAIPSLPILSY